ncbi:MAG: hypothetical protein ABEJ94_06445 [Halorientalis sp.]
MLIATLSGLFLVVGLIVGYRGIPHHFDSQTVQSTETPRDGAMANLGVLYATLILVIGTIVSEWPPAQNFPKGTGDAVFVFSVAATAVIVGRVIRLIGQLEQRVG